MIESVPSATAVATQLQRILESKTFKRADNARAVLDLLVTGALEGRRPTERQLGIRVFGKEDDWAPDSDAVVRVNIKRLKEKLADYYRREGAKDLVVITVVDGAASWEYKRKYSRRSAAPNRQNGLGSELEKAILDYFADPVTGDLRCVVTGEEANLHFLDGDSYNFAIGNVIPLSEQLRGNIAALKQGVRRERLAELDPVSLTALSRRHFSEWRMASAYACAHLAFYMGEPPFGSQSPDLRIQHLSDALSHARHRFNESIAAYIIRHSLLPVVTRIGSLDPRSLCHLALQLSGILDEAGYFEEAAEALALVEDVARRFADLLYQPGSLNRFSILRRRAQLLMERRPADRLFEDLKKEAEEHVYGNRNLPLTLQVVVTARSFRQGTVVPSRQAYEALLPLTEHFEHAVATDSGERPPLIDSSNLAQLFFFSGLAACRVQPGRWAEFAREMILKGKRFCEESGFSLPPEFWATVSKETFEANPAALKVAQLSGRYVMARLRESARTDAVTAISCLRRMLVVENNDDALNWKSPWSAPPSAATNAPSRSGATGQKAARRAAATRRK